MLDPDAILTGMLAPMLRSIPELVALVGGDAANISTYVHSFPAKVDRLRAIHQMKAPGILLAHIETRIPTGGGGGGRSRGIEHEFSAVLRPVGQVGAMFLAMREGIPTVGAGLKFKLTQIDTASKDLLPPLMAGYRVQQIFLDQNTLLEFHEAPIILAERGVDD